MRRVVHPELLDQDAGTPHEIRRSLEDLRRINRWFGGVRTTVAMVQRVARASSRQTLSLLDAGAGSGDVARAVQRVMARQRIRVEVTLADRRLAHLAVMPAAQMPLNHHNHDTGKHGGHGSAPESGVLETPTPVRLIAADALALPFANSSFDLVTCGLLAHHLEPNQLTAFVAEALRVCRLAVLINDLRRSSLSLALVYAGFPLYRSRLTRHDAPASVRRAYTMEEMRAMLHPFGHLRVEITPRYLFRMGVIVWKTGESGK